MSFSGDGLAVVEDIYGLTRVEGCLPPHVSVPRPGPCKGSKAKKAASKAVKPAAKKTSGKTSLDQKIAKPKAVPTAPPAGPPASTPEKKPAKGKPRRISRADAEAMQEQMLGGKEWTRAQKEALQEYSGYFYTEMNGLLRGKPLADDVYTEEEIRRAIRNTRDSLRPLPEPITVFRNVDARALLGRYIPDAEERLAALKELAGQTRQERGFSSTSIRDDLTDFGNEIQLEIDIPAGTPAAYIRSVSESPDEDELVLTPGMKYKFSPLTIDPNGRILMKVKGTPP